MSARQAACAAPAGLRRHPHWETRLIDFAARVRGTPFAWGTWDCVLLAFRALDVMLAATPGNGLTVAWEGRWTCRRSALAAARHTTLEDELYAAGAEPRSPRFASVGDVLVITGRRLPYAGVLLGTRLLSATPHHGVELFTLGTLLAGSDVLALRLG